jgi:hypothetical protein
MCIKHRSWKLGESIPVAPLLLEIILLQLNFPVLLCESARTAAPRNEAVLNRVATNTIALADLFARANLPRD